MRGAADEDTRRAGRSPLSDATYSAGTARAPPDRAGDPRMSTLRAASVAAMLSSVAACGAPGTDTTMMPAPTPTVNQQYELIPGFNPPASPTADYRVVKTPPLPAVDSGKDVTLCTYLDDRFDDDVD